MATNRRRPKWPMISTASLFAPAQALAGQGQGDGDDLQGFEGVISKRLPLSFTLTFADPVYEAGFLRYYAAFYYRYAQAALALGVVLIFLDFLADFVAFPGNPANAYRLSVCIPIVALGLALSFADFARQRWQTLMSALIVLIAVSLFVTLQAIDAENGMGLRSWVGVQTGLQGRLQARAGRGHHPRRPRRPLRS